MIFFSIYSEKKQKPVLVIDLIPLIGLVLVEKRDILYGGRWNLYAGRITEKTKNSEMTQLKLFNLQTYWKSFLLNLRNLEQIWCSSRMG